MWFFFPISKTPKCPLTDERIKKMWYTHTIESQPLKKEQNHAIRGNMDVTTDDHTK